MVDQDRGDSWPCAIGITMACRIVGDQGCYPDEKAVVYCLIVCCHNDGVRAASGDIPRYVGAVSRCRWCNSSREIGAGVVEIRRKVTVAVCQQSNKFRTLILQTARQCVGHHQVVGGAFGQGDHDIIGHQIADGVLGRCGLQFVDGAGHGNGRRVAGPIVIGCATGVGGIAGPFVRGRIIG